jgi:hypothetical protein
VEPAGRTSAWVSWRTFDCSTGSKPRSGRRLYGREQAAPPAVLAASGGPHGKAPADKPMPLVRQPGRRGGSVLHRHFQELAHQDDDPVQRCRTHRKPPGSVMTVHFELDGQTFTALNGGRSASGSVDQLPRLATDGRDSTHGEFVPPQAPGQQFSVIPVFPAVQVCSSATRNIEPRGTQGSQRC